MPRYFFDIHANSLSEWDDDGADAADPNGAIAHGKLMLATIIHDITQHGGAHQVAIMIRDKAGNQIATLTGVLGSEPRVIRPRPISHT